VAQKAAGTVNTDLAASADTSSSDEEVAEGEKRKRSRSLERHDDLDDSGSSAPPKTDGPAAVVVPLKVKAADKLAKKPRVHDVLELSSG